MTATSSIRLNTMDEAIAQLPKRPAVEYRRGQVIYTGAQPSNRVNSFSTGEWQFRSLVLRETPWESLFTEPTSSSARRR